MKAFKIIKNQPSYTKLGKSNLKAVFLNMNENAQRLLESRVWSHVWSCE